MRGGDNVKFSDGLEAGVEEEKKGEVKTLLPSLDCPQRLGNAVKD